MLRSRLQTEEGDLIDAAALAADAARLHSLSFYEQVDYRLVDNGGGTGVEFVARRKDWGPNILNFGMSLEYGFEGRASVNVAGRITRAGINALGAEWRTDLQLGTEPVVFSEFYQPLSVDSRFFVAPHFRFDAADLNVFEGGQELARYRVSEGQLGVDIGRELGLWGEFRVGAFYGGGEADVKAGPASLENLSFSSGGTFASFRVDTLDDAHVPLNGTRIDISWLGSRPGLGADDDFDAIRADILHSRTRGRHTLTAGLSFSTAADGEPSVQNLFTLGGFLNLSGLARGEISGPHAGVARLVYYRRSGAMGGFFDVPFYVGGSLEAGNVWESRSDIDTDSLLINGSLFAGFDTFIGPVFLAAGLGEGDNRSVYLSLGTSIR